MLENRIPIYYPDTMKALPNWVLWKLESDANGRPTKVPYSALYNGKASSTNARTWTSFDKAQHVLARSGDVYNGLGFVFNRESGLVFIDIDHCIDSSGVFNDKATFILNTLRRSCYTELSQSKTGLHVFVRGTIPKAFKHDSVEMYFEGRFVAMTGRALIQSEPEYLPEELSVIYEKYKTADKSHARKEPPETRLLSLSDEEIVRKARENPISGDNFSKLYGGDYSDYESQSNGDLRLCQILAFWTDRDFDTIDRIFRSSGLCREKWTKRQDYRESTIMRACDSIKESLSEYIRRKTKEDFASYEDYFLHE